MRITESQLRRIIRQEVRSLREAVEDSRPHAGDMVNTRDALQQGLSVLISIRDGEDRLLILQSPHMEDQLVGVIDKTPAIDGMRLDGSGMPDEAIYADDLPVGGVQGVVYDPNSGIIAHSKISQALGGQRVSAQRTSIR